MIGQIAIGVIITVAAGFLVWCAAMFKNWIRDIMDRRKVYSWLRSNTRDELGASHVDLRTLSKGTRLPEERVLRACVSDERIYRFSNEPDQWSVWRKEPPRPEAGIAFL